MKCFQVQNANYRIQRTTAELEEAREATQSASKVI
jgi:hypothetical protein